MQKNKRLSLSSQQELQAEVHQRTRKAHEKELAEDYVEAIYNLIETQGEARAVDLSHCLGVTHVTVTKAITRLQRDGLVNTQPYRSIFLTEEGLTLAKACKERHQIVLDFLLSLGISERTAMSDAEGIEHHVSDETLRVFRRLAKRVKG